MLALDAWRVQQRDAASGHWTVRATMELARAPGGSDEVLATAVEAGGRCWVFAGSARTGLLAVSLEQEGGPGGGGPEGPGVGFMVSGGAREEGGQWGGRRVLSELPSNVDCWDVAEGVKCIEVRSEALTWPEAHGACAAAGGGLLFVLNATENERAAAVARQSESVRSTWIGFNDRWEEGFWTWQGVLHQEFWVSRRV